MTQKQKYDDLVTILLTQSMSGLANHNWVMRNRYAKYTSSGKWELSPKGRKKLMNYEVYCRGARR